MTDCDKIGTSKATAGSKVERCSILRLFFFIHTWSTARPVGQASWSIAQPVGQAAGGLNTTNRSVKLICWPNRVTY